VPGWKKQIKDFFTFSKTERRGITVLFIILLVLVLINIFLPYLIKDNQIDFSEFEDEITAFEKQQDHIRDSLSQRFDFTNIDESVAEQKLTPSPFDPNGLPVSKWKELGLNDWQIKVIKNFEKKGGKFRKKEDLSKIYSISAVEYRILEPYIVIKGEKETGKTKSEPLKKLNPFPFDPNQLSKEKWLEMGLRENLVNTIINYRYKGGRFYKNEDMKKIFGMKDEEYAILEPYIKIETDSVMFVIEPEVKKEYLLIELNSADTLDLQQLKGIGPSFSRRIIKYRQMLGGYYKKEQLLEVYGMDSIRYLGIAEYLTVNPDSVKKININTSSVKEMIRHPYIEFYMAKSILTYKNEIGEYTELRQIQNAKLIYKELYQKIASYLSVENTN